MKNKTIPIFKHNFSSPMGAYSIYDRNISYFYKLDNYPKLKTAVLNHELGHSQDKNLYQVMRREVRDYFKIYAMDEYWNMQKDLQKGFKIWQLVIISLQNFFYGVAIIPIYTFAQLYGALSQMYKRFIKK